MLDILEIAREKGLEEGRVPGVEEGKAIGVEEATLEMLFDALMEKFGVVPPRVFERVRTVRDRDALKSLFRRIFRCDSLGAFEEELEKLKMG